MDTLNVPVKLTSRTLAHLLDSAIGDARTLKSLAVTSDTARYYAVLITELEKVIAYAQTYIVGGDDLVEFGRNE